LVRNAKVRFLSECLECYYGKRAIILINYDGYATVIKYGIAFLGKDCLIKMKE
jgi:hypothetical protein